MRYYGILLWGLFLSLLGMIGTLTFLQEVQVGQEFSLGQIASRLLLPHVTLLTGLGMTMAGVILLRKQAILRERQAKEKS